LEKNHFQSRMLADFMSKFQNNKKNISHHSLFKIFTN
jgi:hypothetical protein